MWDEKSFYLLLGKDENNSNNNWFSLKSPPPHKAMHNCLILSHMNQIANCLFRYKFIIRKSFSLKMKFKLCDSTDPFISFQLFSWDLISPCNTTISVFNNARFTSLMKSPMSPGWGAADLMGYCGSGWRGLSSRRRIPTGLMASGSIVSGCWSWLRS